MPVLKDRLREQGLKVGGKKAELVERLLETSISKAVVDNLNRVVVDCMFKIISHPPEITLRRFTGPLFYIERGLTATCR